MITSVSFVGNGIRQWIIMDGESFWFVKKGPDPKVTGKSSVANYLNSLLETKEITEENLYDWLESHVPPSKVTLLKE